MTSAREHALMIKGFLQASHAPADMLAGIEQVIAALTPTNFTITVNSQDMPPGSIAEIAKRFINGRTAALPESPKSLPKPQNSPEKGNGIDATPHGGAVTSDFSPSNEDEKHEVEPPAKPRKQRAPMTPDQRAAKSAMMKALHASGKLKGGRKPKITALDPPEEEKPPFEQPEPAGQKPGRVIPTDIMGERLIDVVPRPEWNSAYRAPQHKGYAGQREDGQLQPGDLVDIRDMLDKHMSKEEICALYGVSEETMDAFLERHQNVRITKVKPPPFHGVKRF